jgi:plastocyanin
MLLSTLLFLAFGVGASHGAELAGRVDAPAGSGPAVVFLQGVTGGALPEDDTVITHRSGGAFEPAVAIGFVGNDFVFRNEDGRLHTTHLYLHLAYQEKVSSRPIKNGATLYNIALPLKGMEVRRPIKAYHEFTDQTGFIDVRCNPHSEESASILVFDHPYATVTAEDGSFTIAGVPAGRHEVWVWHARTVSRWRSVDVSARGATEITIEVSAP